MLGESPGVTQAPTHASRAAVQAGRPQRPGRVRCSDSERVARVAQVAGCFEVRLRRALPRLPAPPVNRSPRAQPPPRGPRARAHLLALVLRPQAPRARPGLPLLSPPCRRHPVLVALSAAGAAPQQLPGRAHPTAELRPPARLPLATPGLPTHRGILEARPPAWAPEVREPPAPPVSRSPHPQLGGGTPGRAVGRGGAMADRGPMEAGPGAVGRVLGGAGPGRGGTKG